ncbi:MAG: DUF2306 domain-containing protein [Pseudomonadota bacterium]
MPKAKQTLEFSSKAWFSVLVAGQWLFVLYIVGFYGLSAMSLDFAAWNEVLPTGIQSADIIGNIYIALHLLLAAAITLTGPLQLISAVRTRAPIFHRWSGELYVDMAVIMSVTGIYIVAVRGVPGGTMLAVSTTLNAVLITVFAFMTISRARRRQFGAHQEWAMRLFLAVSGVWFFRVAFMAYVFLSGGATPGSNRDLTGPVDVAMAFGQYLVPLALYEVYRLTKREGSAISQYMFSLSLILLTIIMLIGIVMAAQFMWLPRLLP